MFKRIIAIVMAGVMMSSIAPPDRSVSFTEETVIEASTEETSEDNEEASEDITEEDASEEEITETEVVEEVATARPIEAVTVDDTEEVTDTVTENTTEEVTEEVIEEEEIIQEITETASTEEIDEESTEAVSEVTEEETVSEETTEAERAPSFMEAVSGVSVAGVDFSSRELLIGTDDPTIFTWDTNVVSEYNGVYLTRYATIEETRNAYTYYYGKVDFVSANITFKVADESDVADLSDLNNGNDAIANLNDLNTNGCVPEDTIALIDTGVSASGLVGSVSVIGDSTTDDNGHGTRMYNFIKEEYPDAKVLSIKAMDASGHGQASDIYAAIQYAIEKGVTVINLSVSAYSTANNAIIKDVIEDAARAGIKVVGSAGNGGANVRYYIPGCISSALIVGACDMDGVRGNSSNYGVTVDYNIVAESTSEASARMSAIWVRDHAFNSDKIFSTEAPLDDKPIEIELDDTFQTTANPEPWDDTDGSLLEVGDTTSGSYTITSRWGSDGRGGIYSDRFAVTLSNGLLGGFSGTFRCIDPGITAGGGSGSSSGSYTATVTNLVQDATTGKETITWHIDLSRPAPGTQRMKILTDYSYSRTIPNYYYVVVRKLVEGPDGKFVAHNNVTFDMWVNGVQIRTPYVVTKDDADKKRYGGYKQGTTINQALWTKYAISFASDDDEYALQDAIGSKTSGYIKYDDSSSSKMTQDGFCLAYLGRFNSKPKVEIRENWNSDESATYIKDTEKYQVRIFSGQSRSGARQKAMNCINNTNGTLASVTWKNLTKPHYFYTTVFKEDKTREDKDNLTEDGKHKLAKISVEGTVIGLFDDVSCTENHLVCRFYFDADGYANIIRDDRNGKGVMDKYLSKSVQWNIKTVSGTGDNQHVQKVLRLNLLDSETAKNTTFYYKELLVPTGFILDETPHVAPILETEEKIVKEDGEDDYKLSQFKVNGSYDSVALSLFNYRRVYAGIKKTSDIPIVSTGNANYSLAGTTYLGFKKAADAQAFRNAADNPSSTTYEAAEAKACIYITLDANGETEPIDVSEVMDYRNGDMQETTFYFVESKAGKGYYRNTNIYTLKVNKNNFIATPISTGVEQDKTAILSTKDKPANDPFQLQIVKKDALTKNEVLPEGKSLEGAEFKVTFYAVDTATMHSSEDLKKNYSNRVDASYSKTIRTQKEITKDKDGNEVTRYVADIGSLEKYPFGFITVEETKSPADYSLKDAKIYLKNLNTGEIVANINDLVFVTSGTFSNNSKTFVGATYYPNGAKTLAETKQKGINLNDATVTFEITDENTPIRGNVEVNKADVITGNPMEGVRFRIDHVKEARKDNVYETEDILETHYIYTDANGHGTTVTKKYENINFYDGPKAYDKTVATVWFENGAEGKTIRPEDGYAALPAGTYCITEEKCEANEGYQLAKPKTFTISEDNLLVTYKTYSDGTAYNVPNPMITKTVATAVIRKKDEEEGDDTKMVPASSGRTIKDTVAYENLKADTKYTLVGRIMELKEDGTVAPFMQGEDEVVVSHTFITDPAPEDAKTDLCASGSESVVFDDLDFTGLQKRQYVVYETLYLGEITEGEGILGNYADANKEDEDKFPIIHEDPTDKDQQFHTPDGGTTAKDRTGTKTVTYTEKVTLTDVVEYKGLEPGREYELTGTLYVRPDDAKTKAYAEYTAEELDAMALKDENGVPVTSTVTHTPETENGSVEVTFTFNANLLMKEAKTLVVFEKETDKKTGITVFTHADINDRRQTLYHPWVSTTAMDTNKRSELAADSEKFYDVISYDNLEPNTKYYVCGTAMNKKTGKALTLAGTEVTADSYFTTGVSNKENGAVKGSFTLEFDITEEMQQELPGVDMVIFETVYVQNKKTGKWEECAQHRELNDEGQELKVPTIKTTLLDKVTKTHVAFPEQKQTLIDTVTYTNLIPGKSYVMEGTLHIQPKKAGDKEEILKDENGNPVTARKTFVASDTGDGTVELTFTFSTKPLYLEEKSVVAFEYCKPEFDKIPVAVHADINDKDQTVQYPKVGTKASLVKKSATDSSVSFVVTDQIMFTNLNTNYEYVAKGWLVDRSGKGVTLGGVEMKAEKAFRPATEAGSVDVTFPEFTVGKYDSLKYVVYEEVYVKVKNADGTEELKLVGKHADLNDSNQTVQYSDAPKTGDSTPLLLFLGIFAFAAAGIGVIIWKKRKLKKEQ